MKKKPKVFIICFLILILGWLFVRMRTYTIADFINIEPGGPPILQGMTLIEQGTTIEEVISLVGRPSSRIGGRHTNNTAMIYNLKDRSRMALSFTAGNHLVSMRISDPNNRVFVMTNADYYVFEDYEIRRHERNFAVADFVNAEPGMSYAEVIALLGVPLGKRHTSNGIIEIFNLGDGSEMRLAFFESDELISLQIVDPIGRVFVTLDEYRTLWNSKTQPATYRNEHWN
jgi:hypothetical protein